MKKLQYLYKRASSFLLLTSTNLPLFSQEGSMCKTLQNFR